MPAFANVDDYIAGQPEEAQPRLRELRAIFRAALPEAVESISYGLPAYRLPVGKAYFGAARKHCAVYGSVPASMLDDLRGFDVEKGTVCFPLDKPVPAELITKLVLAAIAEQQAGRKR